MRHFCFGMFLFALLCIGFETRGEDWPMWRGPRGDGIGMGADVPTTWSNTENIFWKTATDLRSFSTPVMATIQGSPQIILTGAKQTVGLEPESGERIWWVNGPAEKFVCTPSIGLGHIFSFGGSPSERAFAIRQGGLGDLTETHIAWTKERSMPYVPTPLLFGNYLHIVNDAKNELNELVQTSPAIADGALFIRSEHHVWRISERPNCKD